MKPSFEDDWATVYCTDALTGASLLAPQSVHTIMTSPPYWGLRSYLNVGHADKNLELGAEKAPEEYVEKLVAIFRALRPALRDDGTLFLNLGDSYNSLGGTVGGAKYKENGGHRLRQAERKTMLSDLKNKDLVGAPWLVAFALRADGWYLRSDIIWSKPNPMPESVTDRPTKSHEYMFLLTKKPRYYFDQEAVREQHANGLRTDPAWSNKAGWSGNPNANGEQGHALPSNPAGRNVRSVWNIATQPYSGSHYATMPLSLVYLCIKAGTSEHGVCSSCLAPWKRVVERTGEFVQQHWAPGTQNKAYIANGPKGSNSVLNTGHIEKRQTVGWQPTCSCTAGVQPATVLDPFMGSGTTALAARKLGRKSIGFDLDERNIKLLEERLGHQGVLL